MRVASRAVSQRCRNRTSECHGRDAAGKATMTYDVTISALRPGTRPGALARWRQRLPAAEPGGEFLPCWYSDLGALNQILLIRCCDDEASLATERAAVLTSKDPFGVGELTLGMTMDTFVSFPFIPRMTPGKYGSFYEVLNYVLGLTGIAFTIE